MGPKYKSKHDGQHIDQKIDRVLELKELINAHLDEQIINFKHGTDAIEDQTSVIEEPGNYNLTQVLHYLKSIINTSNSGYIIAGKPINLTEGQIIDDDSLLKFNKEGDYWEIVPSRLDFIIECDGLQSEYSFNHNMNRNNVICQLSDEFGNIVYALIKKETENIVNVKFGTPPIEGKSFFLTVL